MTEDQLERDTLAWLSRLPGGVMRHCQGRSSETARAVEALVDIAWRERSGLDEEWTA